MLLRGRNLGSGSQVRRGSPERRSPFPPSSFEGALPGAPPSGPCSLLLPVPRRVFRTRAPRRRDAETFSLFSGLWSLPDFSSQPGNPGAPLSPRRRRDTNPAWNPFGPEAGQRCGVSTFPSTTCPARATLLPAFPDAPLKPAHAAWKNTVGHDRATFPLPA